MGNRLSAIATRTGDAGTTGLGDGSRVSKADPRVAAMGDVDELNCAVGMLIALGVPTHELAMNDPLADVQQDLLDLGGELSIPGYTLLKAERVAALDDWLARANATLPRLQEFIRPGGSMAAAQAHVCRTVCRRAERGGPSRITGGQPRRPPVPESPVRPDVRDGPRAQPGRRRRGTPVGSHPQCLRRPRQ
jgi:cob(I)alamin adenosyltransferase